MIILRLRIIYNCWSRHSFKNVEIQVGYVPR